MCNLQELSLQINNRTSTSVVALGMLPEKKRPEKWRTNSWFLLRDNTHRSGLFKDFLAKNDVTTLDHHSYSPNLVPAMAQLVEALRYSPEVRGFDSLQCHWNFSLT